MSITTPVTLARRGRSTCSADSLQGKILSNVISFLLRFTGSIRREATVVSAHLRATTARLFSRNTDNSEFCSQERCYHLSLYHGDKRLAEGRQHSNSYNCTVKYDKHEVRFYRVKIIPTTKPSSWLTCFVSFLFSFFFQEKKCLGFISIVASYLTLCMENISQIVALRCEKAFS